MAGQSSGIDRTGYEMQRLLERRPTVCAICQVVDATMRTHIDHLFYERVTDIATRDAIRQAKGFCRHHARLVSQQADALGTALIMQDILVNELRAIEAGTFERSRATPGLFARFFDSGESTTDEQRTCPLCTVERETEQQTAGSLLAGLADADFAAIFRRSAGLCLPHFHLTCSRAGASAAWTIVVETQKRALTALTAELGELARKSDYRYSHEAIGEESDSWRRGLAMTSGWTEQ
jgi:hypothetical protein